jgi:succinoglycan biosynthesis protein ExoW
MTEVSVIVPYYQRQPGVLRGAIGSVLQQSYTGGIEVVIVDDTSPVPAEGELAGLSFPPHVRAHIIRQPNGGPAAARNRGLAERSSAAAFVALLDSDDVWEPYHLARAVESLTSHGGSFYFSNFYQLDQSVGAFERAGRLQIPRHQPLPHPASTYLYQGDMRHQVLTGNLIGTSTVVFDCQRHAAIRFREEYYSAGEDYLCWMDFAAAGATFMFSTLLEVRYGRGVNIYAGALWGTDGHLVRTQNEIRYLKAATRIHQLPAEVQVQTAGRVARLRSEFALSLAHRVRATAGVPWSILGSQLREDWPTVIGAPFQVIRHALGRRTRSGSAGNAG